MEDRQKEKVSKWGMSYGERDREGERGGEKESVSVCICNIIKKDYFIS